MKSRIFVVESVVKYRSVRAYDLAKNAPFVASTIYYALERLKNEGVVERRGEYYVPTFKAVLEYYKLKGCDDYLANALAAMVGLMKHMSQEELCAVLRKMAVAEVDAKTPAAAIMEYFKGKLNVKELLSADPEVKKFVAVVFAGADAEIDGDHTGLLVGGIFVGFCRKCGLVVAPCRNIRL